MKKRSPTQTLAQHLAEEAAWFKKRKFQNRLAKKASWQDPHETALVGSLVEGLITIGDELPKSRLMSFDDHLLNLYYRTRNIETEKFVGALRFTNLPADKMFLEGPHFIGSNIFMGALVTKKPDFGGFSFLTVVNNKANAYDLEGFSAEVHVSPETGIQFDEEKTLLLAQQLADASDPKMHQAGWIIDHYYHTADFLTRVFVILSSTNLVSNFATPLSDADRNSERKNQEHQRMGLPLKLSVTPIIIDVTKSNGRLLNPDSSIPPELLLGLTHVKPSRIITRPDGSTWLRKKDGKPWIRREHDRRIKAEVDRRHVSYDLTARRALEVAVGILPDRPALLLPLANRTGGPETKK